MRKPKKNNVNRDKFIKSKILNVPNAGYYHSSVTFIFAILIVCFTTPSLLGQLSVSNQLEYSYWNEFNRNILENWTDVSYQIDNYRFGFRYELNQPPDPFVFPFDSLLKQEELTIMFAEVYVDALTLTIGNYYRMFGRGLTLRTYEDRNLRVDTNIEGIMAGYYNPTFEITALGGRMRDLYNRRDDRIYAIDAEVRILEYFEIGGSFLRNQLTDNNFSEFRAARIEANFNQISFYSEAAFPSWTSNVSNYSSLTFTSPAFSITAEYKDYDQMGFFTSFGTPYNAPPALSREHSYSLLNRHPHQLNTNDEKGYQFEMIYYGLDDVELLFNNSLTESHDKQVLFREYYGHVIFEGLDNWHYEGVLGWNRDVSTENITPIAMVEYNWAYINNIHIELQHQHVKNLNDLSEYDDEMIVLEYTRAPGFGIAVVGEYSNQYKLENTSGLKKYWLYTQATISFLEGQQLSILYGSRQAGFVCVGGVCRLEPEFEGFELKLFSRF